MKHQSRSNNKSLQYVNITSILSVLSRIVDQVLFIPFHKPVSNSPNNANWIQRT